MLYVKLYHGRIDPNQDMNDWGSDGPIFGPYDFFRTTYLCHIKMGLDSGDVHELYVVEDMIYYDGVYYGDWSVFPEEIYLKENQSLRQPYDSQKADLPKKQDVPTRDENPPVKIIIYIKGGICQEIKTNLSDGSWEYSVVDYDNEPALPDGYMPYGLAEMKALPSMAVVRNLIDAATSVTEDWESGDLAGSVRKMTEILDRIKES